MSTTVGKSRKVWRSILQDHDDSMVDAAFRREGEGDTMVLLERTESSGKNKEETSPKSVGDGQTFSRHHFANPGSARMNPSASEFAPSQSHESVTLTEDRAHLIRLPALQSAPADHQQQSLVLRLERGDASITAKVNRLGGAPGEADADVNTTPPNSLFSAGSREPTRFTSETSVATRDGTLRQQRSEGDPGGERHYLPLSQLIAVSSTSASNIITTNSVSSTAGYTPPTTQLSSSHSADFPLSSANMGYIANEVSASSWSAAESLEKMIEPAEYDQSCSLNEGKHRDDDETATVQSFDSTTISSPAIVPIYPPILLEGATAALHPAGDVETPSTVSTVAESDDASLGQGDLYLLDRSYAAGDSVALGQGQQYHHQRAPSWEQSPQPAQEYDFLQQAFPTSHSLPPPFVPSQAAAPAPWGQQRVTSFRSDASGDSSSRSFLSYPSSAVERPWQHQHQAQVQQNAYPTQVPFLPGRGTPPIDNRMYHRHNQGNLAAYHMVQQPLHQLQQHRKVGGYSPVVLAQQPATTPPRPRSSRPAPPQSPHRGGYTGGIVPQGSLGPLPSGASRSSSEVLKTLLRKKACLYEPDTSRAVALVTWLVGRELALEFGFFSRQQLQAGVHACVADKIDAGIITRTKVNRCMQIILNSCFHYIIPRPDGTEENGDVFRAIFAAEGEDEYYLLKYLPEPWTDVTVDIDEVLVAAQAADLESKSGKKAPELVTPQSSPKLSSASPPPEKLSPRDDSLDIDDAHRRSVLLCFNENVRRAEDVFRCHNEFIRDTAHASHLQLSSQEWRVFFGHEAAAAPACWGNIGIPVQCTDVHGSSHVDALGMMTPDEAGKFRTTWCTKRYDHDHELCGFAHAEVNSGWLRRNPTMYQYKDEMCPFVTTVNDKQTGQSLFVINECPLGVSCELAHSSEEMTYHPRRYKMRACPSAGRPGGCNLCDVCPHFHPIDTYRFPRKADGRSTRHSKYSHQVGGAKGAPASPCGAPIVFSSPAPLSSFEEHLLMPGLRNLYRRQSAVVRARMRSRGSTCHYSYFGDNDGVSDSA